MALNRVKILVDQVSEQVVWLSYFLDTQPPSLEINLNFFMYSGSTELNLWKLYLSYQLHYNIKSKTFYKKSINPATFKQVQFSRAKCMAVNWISSACDYQYEKYNYSNHQMYMDQSEYNKQRWVDVIMHTHGCTADQADKLLKFKREEYELAVFQLESLRYTFTDKIKKAQTIEQVNQHYEETVATLISPNSIKLVTSPIIQGVNLENLESGQNQLP
jgi:hypothetical protein